MTISKGFHWSVDARRNRNLDKRKNQPYQGTYFSKVASSIEGERVFIQNALGDKIINFAYPFSSRNAWIRGQPEIQTTMLTVIGADSRELHPISYFDATKSGAVGRYIDAADQLRQSPSSDVARIPPYRNLQPGEIDSASNFAQTFHGLKDVMQTRGGLSHLNLNSKSASVDTPLFQVHGPAYKVSSSLMDEMRFGVVRRATSTSSATFPSLIRSSQPSVRNPLTAAFAKEHTVVLGSYGIFPLSLRLIDHRQGNVIEDNGDKATSINTGQELRARYRWFSNLSETSAEIDQTGNWYLSTANDALSGGKVSIPTGPFTMDVGQGFSIRANSDIQLTSSVGNFVANATAGFSISTLAIGSINATTSLRLSTTGVLTVEANAIVLGGQILPNIPLIRYPVLIANPLYISSLQGWLGSESAFNSTIGAYAANAAAAWSAAGALLSALDPSGTVTTLCLNAGSAATALATQTSFVTTALSSHIPTLGMNPIGFQSMRLLSE